MAQASQMKIIKKSLIVLRTLKLQRKTANALLKSESRRNIEDFKPVTFRGIFKLKRKMHNQI